MDNTYHALIMAGSILMFLIGISVAVYNYSQILELNDKILTNSEYSNRDAENFEYSQYTTGDELNTDDLKRIYSSSQVARMIINMYEANVSYIDPLTGSDIDVSWLARDTNGKIIPQYTRNDSTQPVDLLKSQDINCSEIKVEGIDTFKRDTNTLSSNPNFKALVNAIDQKYIIDSSESTFDSVGSVITFKKKV